MPNTSATGGYLTPAGSPAPLEDAALDAALQNAVAGITGLPGAMVRPRWQPVVPKQPEPIVDWCAIGVMDQTPDDGPAIQHTATGDGVDSLVRHEEISVLATFYGPNGKKYAGLLRDGLSLPQNIEALKKDGIAFVASADIRTVPELVNQQWIRRFDMSLRFRRKVSRAFSVLNVLGADVHLFDDTRVDELIQVPPAP